MSQTKVTILTRLFSGVVKPVAGAADWLSWIAFIIAVGLCIVAFCFKLRWIQLPDSADFYDRRYWQLAYSAWILFVLSTIGPLLHIAKERAGMPLGILASVAVIHVIAFIGISVFVLADVGGGAGAITALLGAAAGAAMAGVGWVMQYQSASRSSRRSHTFNVLMQSRLSKEFQEHVRRRLRAFPTPCEISVDDACIYGRKQLKEAVDALKAQIEIRKRDSDTAKATDLDNEFEVEKRKLYKKYISIDSVKYLLNFYEFLCAGIESGDLDEDLLFETLGGIAAMLCADTKNLRRLVQVEQSLAFEHFDRIVAGQWMERARKQKI